jgi:hypothetical protein
LVSARQGPGPLEVANRCQRISARNISLTQGKTDLRVALPGCSAISVLAGDEANKIKLPNLGARAVVAMAMDNANQPCALGKLDFGDKRGLGSGGGRQISKALQC